MPKPNLPGFTAEAASSTSRHSYRATPHNPGTPRLIPQLAPGTGTTTNTGGLACSMCVFGCTLVTGDIVACFTACQGAGACGTITARR
ncbi:MAG: hypothetical protein JNK87_01345 [Bryobacterales bacterium]|nr:hypothetical protein [Bryobacterales bacterium]